MNKQLLKILLKILFAQVVELQPIFRYICAFRSLFPIMIKNRAIIAIGANIPEKERVVNDTIITLSERYPDSRFSSAYITPAVGSCVGDPPYCNAVGVVMVDADYETLHTLLKEMELSAGRTPQSKFTGLIPLDIDIVAWNDTILRPRDMQQVYVAIGLAELEVDL